MADFQKDILAKFTTPPAEILPDEGFDNKITMIDPELIREYGSADRQQFFSFSAEKVQEIAESAKIVGIQTPAIVRLDPLGKSRYEMLSGRHRMEACKLLGIKLPCIIKECDDVEAAAIYASTNRQRESITLLEKAWTYRLEYDHLKRSVGRPEKLSQNETIYETANTLSVLAENNSESRATIHRLIRLTYVVDKGLINLLNEKSKRLPIGVAVELSYLKPKEQEWCYDLLAAKDINIFPLALAKEIKEQSKNSEENIDVFLVAKPYRLEEEAKKDFIKANKKLGITLPKEALNLFPKEIKTKDERENYIIKLLKENLPATE